MPNDKCWLCEHYGWNTIHDIYYYDEEEDKKYCIFHSPSAVTRGYDYNEDTKRFQDLATDMFRQGINNGHEINLSGAIFPTYIDFSEFAHTPLPPINFLNVNFEQGANFGQLIFDNKATFSGAKFGTVNFVNSQFKVCDFSLTEFYSEALFMGSKFTNLSNFSYSTFTGWTDFSKSTLTNVNFHAATFNSETFFKDCHFHETPQNHQSALFISTTFNSQANFAGSTFYATDFIETAFTTGADFSHSEILGPFSLRGIKPVEEKLTFYGCNAKSIGFINFTSRELEFIKFSACSWPEKLYFEMETETLPSKPTSTTFNEIEELYRGLKLQAADQNDQKKVSQWHYREMEMVLSQIKLNKPIVWRLTVTWLYRLLSGYGERPVRSGVALLIIWLIPLLYLSIEAVASTGFVWLTFDTQVALNTLNSWVYYMPLVKASPSGTTWGMWISQLAISGQATLLGLALRNKFKR